MYRSGLVDTLVTHTNIRRGLPNSLVRRPPWLHASSVKNKTRAYCPNIYTVLQGKFGTYAKFYQHFFVSNKEVIGCSKKLSNLLKNCLSPLVPHEPASVLRTHLSNQIQAKSLYISHKVNSRCNT